MKKILLYSFILTWITSCTIEKRHYTDGYHVDWIGKTKKVESTRAKSQKMDYASAENPSSPAQIADTKEIGNTDVAVPVTKPTLTWKDSSKKPLKMSASKKTVMKLAQRTLAITPNYATVPMHEGLANTSIKAFNFSAEPDTFVMVLLCLFIPFLAVYFHEGSWTSRCTVNLILCLVCGIPGIIHAFIVCFGD